MAKRKPAKVRVPKQHRLRRIEQMILRGITNQEEIAAAFGVLPNQISLDIKEIEARWKATWPEEIEQAKIRRVRQIENVLRLAANAFDKSRQDATEVTIKKEPCGRCVDGVARTKEGKKYVCKNCGGEGYVETQTTRIIGQTGNPAYLKIMHTCIVEAGRVEGIYPRSTLTASRKLSQEIEEIDGTIKRQIQEVFIEGDEDIIIRYRALLDDMAHRMKKGEMKMIESQAEPIDYEVPETDEEEDTEE